MTEQSGGNINDFSQGKVSSQIIRMAIPTTIAQIINVLYNIVDRMYVGNIPVTGEAALTGLGIALPVVSLVTAFSNLCGFGGAPLCSIARGGGRLDEARELMGCSFSMLLISGAVIMAVFLGYLEQLLTLFGADALTLPYAKDYTFVYLLGTEFVMIALGMNSFINSQGFARIGMRTVLLGAALNIVLDPIFIYDWGLGLGVRGAALATIISQAASAAWVLCFLTGKKALFTLSWDSMRLRPQHVKSILKLGSSGFMFGATNSLVQTVTNRMLMRTGGSVYVGIMAIAYSVREVAMLIQRGLARGGEPVISYNYGAKRYDRVMQSVRFMLGVVLIYSSVATALVLAFPETIIRLFNDSPDMLEKGAPALSLFFCMQFTMTFQFIGQSTFVSTNHPAYAVFFSLFRKVIVIVPMVLLLPGLWGLGPRGVFLAEAVSDVAGGIVCFITMRLTVWRRMKRETEAAPAQENSPQ